MKIKESYIIQIQSEPPRRYFTDTQHFDVFVWYRNSNFDKIIGFQIGYKENPFNTDKEYFITQRAATTGDSKVELGKTGELITQFPAPKLIRPTDAMPPKTFFKQIRTVLEDLPEDIRIFL